MSHYKIQDGLTVEITEDGRLKVYDAGKLTYTFSTEESLRLILWLRQYQNFIALAKAHQDESHALLIEIEQGSEQRDESL